jgi:hypothetical protein
VDGCAISAVMSAGRSLGAQIYRRFTKPTMVTFSDLAIAAQAAVSVVRRADGSAIAPVAGTPERCSCARERRMAAQENAWETEKTVGIGPTVLRYLHLLDYADNGPYSVRDAASRCRPHMDALLAAYLRPAARDVREHVLPWRGMLSGNRQLTAHVRAVPAGLRRQRFVLRELQPVPLGAVLLRLHLLRRAAALHGLPLRQLLCSQLHGRRTQLHRHTHRAPPRRMWPYGLRSRRPDVQPHSDAHACSQRSADHLCAVQRTQRHANFRCAHRRTLHGRALWRAHRCAHIWCAGAHRSLLPTR